MFFGLLSIILVYFCHLKIVQSAQGPAVGTQTSLDMTRYPPLPPAITPSSLHTDTAAPPQLPRRQHSACGDAARHPADAGDAVPRVDDNAHPTRGSHQPPDPPRRPLTSVMPKRRAGCRANLARAGAKGGKVGKSSSLDIDPNNPVDNAFVLVSSRFS